MLMPPFELHHPNTVDEAVEMAARLMKNGEAFDWVAGGTDVLPNYKWRINPKPHVISLAGIEETRLMTATELGCTVPLSSLTTENGVHPLLVEAAAKVASSLVRKSATVGGDLCLDTLLLVQPKRRLAPVHRLVSQSRLRNGRRLSRHSQPKHPLRGDLPG